MPSHKIHKYVSRLLLGKSFTRVHQALDRPYIFLGRKHRSMFHTYPEAFLVGSLASPDPHSGTAACLHVLTDKLCSKNKKLRKWLKISAKQDALWRKQMREWKKQMRQWKRLMRRCK